MTRILLGLTGKVLSIRDFDGPPEPRYYGTHFRRVDGRPVAVANGAYFELLAVEGTTAIYRYRVVDPDTPDASQTGASAPMSRIESHLSTSAE